MNEVSPVTESDMNSAKEYMSEFFRKMSTMVVRASDQARQLEVLNHRLGEIHNEVHSLVDQNNKLKTEVAETWQAVALVEKERDEAKADASVARRDLETANDRHTQDRRDYEDRLAAAHDAMAGRDQRIAELERQLSEVSANARESEAKAVSFEQSLKSAQDNAEWWQGKHNVEKENHARAQSAYAKAADERDLLGHRLAEVQSKLAEVTSILAPPAPPVVRAIGDNEIPF